MKLMGISKLNKLADCAGDILGGAVPALVAELEAGTWQSMAEIADFFPSAVIEGIKIRIRSTTAIGSIWSPTHGTDDFYRVCGRGARRARSQDREQGSMTVRPIRTDEDYQSALKRPPYCSGTTARRTVMSSRCCRLYRAMGGPGIPSKQPRLRRRSSFAWHKPDCHNAIRSETSEASRECRKYCTVSDSPPSTRSGRCTSIWAFQ